MLLHALSEYFTLILQYLSYYAQNIRTISQADNSDIHVLAIQCFIAVFEGRNDDGFSTYRLCSAMIIAVYNKQ